MAKPNYRHAKKQKEAARKARQDAKQQRKGTTPDSSESAELPLEPAAVVSPDVEPAA